MKSSFKSAISLIRRSRESLSASRVKGDLLIDQPALLLGGMLTAAFLFCYAGVMKMMALQWWTNDMYSYGFLIPWISFYLVWARRERLKLIEPVPNFKVGVVIVTGGLASLIFGHAGTLLILQELSLIVTLAGILLLVLGMRFFHALLFPLSYLILMIPIWDAITDHLHLPFQMLSSVVGLSLLQVMGIPAYRHGLFIELPNVVLEVAKACSGVNYLIAIIAIGIPSAYLFLSGWVRRVALVVMAVSVAILSNGVRVALIGTLSYYGLAGEGDIHGPLHILQGMFVSAVGYAGLFAGVWLLAPAPSAPQAGEEKASVVEERSSAWKLHPTGVISLSAILLLTGSYLYFYRAVPISLKKDFKSFPYAIGEWKGADAAPSPSLLNHLEPSQRLSRLYRNTAGEEAHLYIGYFETQVQDKKLLTYKTDRLFEGAAETEIALDPYRTIRVNKKVLQEGDRSKLVLFWYELNGKTVANFYKAKLYTMWNTLAHKRTNGAMIVFAMDIPATGDVKPSPLGEKFIPEIFPLLSDYFPEGR